jgi:hypothetical protein
MKSKLIKKSDGWYNLYDGEIGIGSTHAELQGHKLSKQNCDEIFGVVDVEKYVDEYAAEWKYTERIGFRDGFNKAMELNKDKVFTLEDMRNSLLKLVSEISCTDGVLDGKSPYEASLWINNYIQSLQQPIEVEVEIKMEPCFYDDSLGGFSTSYTEDKPKEQPKLDSDGCLILKKI